MTDPQIEELIATLKTARTTTEIARTTAALLQVCGVYNLQGVGLELARMHVTKDGDGFGKPKHG